MLNIILFGGGRWSRVIVSVLNNILDKKCNIIWVSNHNIEALRVWVDEKSYNNIDIIQNDSSIWVRPIDASIIATAPHTHAVYAEQSIQRGIPTFVEKPFTTNLAEAKKLHALSVAQKCPVGVDLVFMFASYLQEFSATVSKHDIKTINIIWHDPVIEIRHNETKKPDFYTSVPHDMFPHVWSLLKVIIPDLDYKLCEVLYEDNNDVIVKGRHNAIKLNISFSRRSNKRMRKISINDDDCILDFTKEPGFLIENGTRSEYKWTGETPLFASLKSFLNIVNDDITNDEWAISLDKISPCFKITDDIDNALKTLQRNNLKTLYNENNIDVLVDLFLPQLAALGIRMQIETKEEQNAFALKVKELFFNQ